MTELNDILNWRRINARLTTSGQPDAEQLKKIRDIGVTHVVNLGLSEDKAALANEAGIVASLGMEYTHIPVVFEAPTDQDFEAFKEAIERAPEATMHIHCIYNARVSAFFYRYSRMVAEVAEDKATEIMESIWRPGDDWAAFIDNVDARGMPNRYAGDDY